MLCTIKRLQIKWSDMCSFLSFHFHGGLIFGDKQICIF